MLFLHSSVSSSSIVRVSYLPFWDCWFVSVLFMGCVCGFLAMLGLHCSPLDYFLFYYCALPGFLFLSDYVYLVVTFCGPSWLPVVCGPGLLYFPHSFSFSFSLWLVWWSWPFFISRAQGLAGGWPVGSVCLFPLVQFSVQGPWGDIHWVLCGVDE